MSSDAAEAKVAAEPPVTNSTTTTSNNNNNNVTVGTLEDAKNSDRSDKGRSEETERYMYCDFAQIEEEEYDVDYEIDQEGLLQALEESTAMAAAQTTQHQSMAYVSQPPPVLRASGWVRSQRFPVKLYALLSQPQLSHIISWMPHGRSWKVLKPRIFETAVLPGETCHGTRGEEIGETLGAGKNFNAHTRPILCTCQFLFQSFLKVTTITLLIVSLMRGASDVRVVGLTEAHIFMR